MWTLAVINLSLKMKCRVLIINLWMWLWFRKCFCFKSNAHLHSRQKTSTKVIHRNMLTVTQWHCLEREEDTCFTYILYVHTLHPWWRNKTGCIQTRWLQIVYQYYLYKACTMSHDKMYYYYTFSNFCLEWVLLHENVILVIIILWYNLYYKNLSIS